MKLTIFMKTFIILLVSFSLVFLLSMYISYVRFSPMYLAENIEAVTENLLEEAPLIQNGKQLSDTKLSSLSSETSFIRYNNFTITDSIGPDFLTEDTLVDFVINMYDNNASIQEDKLTYYVEQIEDVYHINYIYEYDFGDYIIISTQIQSLQNVDRVLTNINITQSIMIFSLIVIISFIISRHISKPIKAINLYAQDISNLKFDSKIDIKRQDEFKDLITSLNEMTYNLQISYQQLNNLNDKLADDIAFEKKQEEKKKSLIMTINHEIKTPIAVIKGMVEGMIDGVGRYKDKDKYLKELQSQIEDIEKLTQDLTYSLSLEDKATLNDSCSTQIIKTKLNSILEYANINNVKVALNIKDAIVNMNEELLGILIVNVVKNAVNYTFDNNVIVTTSKTQTEYIISIKNKGFIPEEDLQQIFDMFYRSKNKNKPSKGQGLGLFIVKQICDIYGNQIKIFNDNGSVHSKIILKLK